MHKWKHSSVGRASALQAEGHRFEPYCFHHQLKRIHGIRFKNGLVVQSVRTLACHARGQGFESLSGRHFLSLCSSVGRAGDWKSPCRWFDSDRRHHICGFSSFGRAQPCQGWGGGFDPRNPLQKHGYAKRTRYFWSGLRGSNPPPSPWQGDALPNELNPHWWCLRSESNQRHGDFQSPALPTELQRHTARAAPWNMATRMGLEPTTSSVTG